MPRTSSPAGLAELLEQQSSVVSREQLLALGMKDHAMQYRVRRGGPWQILLPGVYLTASGVPSLSQKEVAALLYAVQLGRCTVSQLAEELRTGPVRGSAVFRSVLAEVADGIRSTAEGDLRDVVRTARLPMPLFNPSLYDGDLFLGKPDGWWPDAGVAGEVDSRAWHLSPDDWDRTRRRHDLMAAAGVIVLHFSPRELRREPAKVAEMIKGALERGLNRPPLPIRTIPCPGSMHSGPGPMHSGPGSIR
jgi:hypothetical protein